MPTLPPRTLRCWLATGLWLVNTLVAGHSQAASPPEAATRPQFSFALLREWARALAAKDYRPAPVDCPDFLKKLTYDEYQAIRFRPDHAPWQGEALPFALHLFHPGYLCFEPVRIHLLERDRVTEMQFAAEQFDFGSVRFPNAVPSDLPHAGVEILYPMNRAERQDEVAVFLGGIYIRLLGAHQHFGASARALAINTAGADGEEFPGFTEFWIVLAVGQEYR